MLSCRRWGYFMVWEIKLRVEWPNASFQRAGFVFTKTEPIVMATPCKAIMDEPALVKTEIGVVKEKKEEKTEAKSKLKRKRKK